MMRMGYQNVFDRFVRAYGTRFSHALMTLGSPRHIGLATRSRDATVTPGIVMFQRSRISPASLIGVAFAHAGLLLWVALAAPKTVMSITPTRPLTVSLIKPQPKPVAKPETKRPVPKPVLETKPQPAVLVAKRPVPSPIQAVEAPQHTPEPEPVPEVAPTPDRVVAEARKPAPPSPTPPRPADYLNNPKPPYPALSRRLGEEGVVRLNILVNPDGSVARLELSKSSGYPRLDQSAMDTVQSSWKFEPARQDGSPVAAWVIVPIQFTVRS